MIVVGSDVDDAVNAGAGPAAPADEVDAADMLRWELFCADTVTVTDADTDRAITQKRESSTICK